MNNEIKTILDTITAGEPPVAVPNALLYFDGQADAFLVYSPSNESVGLSGDDEILALVTDWDVDIYSKTNYLALSQQIIKAFIDAGWVYKGAGSDTYDEATSMYHRLLEFGTNADVSFLTEEGE